MDKLKMARQRRSESNSENILCSEGVKIYRVVTVTWYCSLRFLLRGGNAVSPALVAWNAKVLPSGAASFVILMYCCSLPQDNRKVLMEQLLKKQQMDEERKKKAEEEKSKKLDEMRK